MKIITGTIKRHPDGFGILIPDSDKDFDVFIPRNEMSGVMSKDYVSVVHAPGGRPNRPYGKVQKILKRGNSEVLGPIHILSDSKALVIDENNSWGSDLIVKINKESKLNNNDLVVAKITSYPDSENGFIGEIIKIIGDRDNPKYDIERALFKHSILPAFSPNALEETKKIETEISELVRQERTDLTKIHFVTIDGATAKDFDDAIYTEKTKFGFLLYIGIADVSHYVKKKTHLDEDARLKGNSTYFPGFVAPMLPEKLSNELCSLKPNVERLSFVVKMEINHGGDVTKSEAMEAIIKSKARLTYGEAQDIIDGVYKNADEKVNQNVLLSSELAKILMKSPSKNSAVDLDIPETQVILDEMGIPTDIIKSERLFSHKLIEELMVLTNVVVAVMINNKGKDNIYRVHARPDQDRLKNLENFLHNMGEKVHLSRESKGLQKNLSEVLKKYEDTSRHRVLSLLILRSMKQAQYSPDNVGHFGLGLEHYSHFTSPIRRYSDLITHRILKKEVLKLKKYHNQGYSFEELTTLGNTISGCEQRSVRAERDLNSFKRARFMLQFVGQTFEGIISGITQFGIFVLLRKYDVDGIIKIEKLGNEYFEFIEDQLKLIGKKTGLTYQIGDPLKIKVEGANPEKGHVDFVLETQPAPRSKRTDFIDKLDSIIDKKHRGGNKNSYHKFKGKKDHKKDKSRKKR